MNTKDLRTLWARAGNRCSFYDCKLELTPSGSLDTIGEMAHIVAESPEGPRGKSDLALDQRDGYSNRILLCRNHHKVIDNDPEKWTVEQLHTMKEDHEHWVTQRLDEKKISIREIDNSAFLQARKDDWAELCGSHIWAISGIAPLEIVDGIINPLDHSILNILKTLEMWHLSKSGHQLRGNHIRPNQFGVILEDFDEIATGIGQRIQIFGNGYCEICTCLEQETKRITEGIHQKLPEQKFDFRVLNYRVILDTLNGHFSFIKNIWDSRLPFYDLLLTSRITGTDQTRLYSRDLGCGHLLLGYPYKGGCLEYIQVIDRLASLDFVLEGAMKYVAHSYGLVLDSLRNLDGEFARPRRFELPISS